MTELPHDALAALNDEVALLARHGRQLQSRHLLRCLQAKRLLEDPEFEIELDEVIQKHCDENRVIGSTDRFVARAGLS